MQAQAAAMPNNRAKANRDLGFMSTAHSALLVMSPMPRPLLPQAQ
jgi:hypothetical protein